MAQPAASPADRNSTEAAPTPLQADSHGRNLALGLGWPFFEGRLEVGPVEVAGRGGAAGSAPGDPSSAAELLGGPAQGEGEGEVGVDPLLDERCQDVGNVVQLEHINLEVPDLEVARLFFGEGLGLSADPGTTASQRGGLHVMWYNCGRQQFHIARGPAPQRLPPGSVVGLVMPDVGAVAERLEGVRQLLGDVSLTYARSDTLEVVDPYGNNFVVHASLPYFPGRQGIAYLQLPCFRGTATRIAAFYASRMGARCRVSSSSSTSSTSTNTISSSGDTGNSGGGGASRSSRPSSSHQGPVRAEVLMGAGQKLVFVEQAQLGALSEQAVVSLFGGWHIAMYVADFSRTFRAVHHPDRPPFNQHPYRDKYTNLQDALRNRQFRFQDIVGPKALAVGPGHGRAATDGIAAPGASGIEGGGSELGSPASGSESGSGNAGGKELLYRISHEVRSLHHPLYGRPLYGRESGFV